MRLALALKQALLGAILVFGFAAGGARAAVFEVTEALTGTAFQSRVYTFNISTLGQYSATLTDVTFLTPFDFLALGISKSGTLLGKVVSPPDTLPNSFNFDATVAGTYSAIVFATPNVGNTFNVTVAAVPEPEVWVMMLVGFGLVVFRLRQQSRKADAQRFA